MTPPILSQARNLLACYDVIFCDVWGVLHNGVQAYAAAGDALARFRASGGTVVLVSNAPVPAAAVARLLDARRVRRDAWDEIVSGGDLARRYILDHGLTDIHFIGPRDRDSALVASLDIHLVPLADAAAILCTGLVDDVGETAEIYAERLKLGLDRGLVFVCANPDRIVDVGGRLYPCAGAIAEVYERMGGRVMWAGKPYPEAYAAALGVAEALRAAPVARDRILVIGDAIATDLAGAETFGVDALFIAGGIHREEVAPDGPIDPARLAARFAKEGRPAVGAMPELAW